MANSINVSAGCRTSHPWPLLEGAEEQVHHPLTITQTYNRPCLKSSCFTSSAAAPVSSSTIGVAPDDWKRDRLMVWSNRDVSRFSRIMVSWMFAFASKLKSSPGSPQQNAFSDNYCIFINRDAGSKDPRTAGNHCKLALTTQNVASTSRSVVASRLNLNSYAI